MKLQQYYSCQNLIRIRMVTRSKLPRGFPKTSTTLRVHSEASAISGLLETALYREDVFDPASRHFETFTTLKSSPPHVLLQSETQHPVVSKASASILNLQ